MYLACRYFDTEITNSIDAEEAIVTLLSNGYVVRGYVVRQQYSHTGKSRQRREREHKGKGIQEEPTDPEGSSMTTESMPMEEKVIPNPFKPRLNTSHYYKTKEEMRQDAKINNVYTNKYSEAFMNVPYAKDFEPCMDPSSSYSHI